ncbi:hypothetical protein SAMN05216338_108816 [Bradyrhizobium sp. Rc2d]|uniref:tetratricopeptide repeat protein n=1 Tax=Bradyrhizobium sp. Rc2d TaxID=1855321 RepID=UPI00088ABE67|nr:tetratricopeptide repeat protein [Bradyrhizobium sp. Rc2d]SDK10659.1 hypothetical protein SAMN05216338_108816 [Bradyrhizobium sp. Rc2d]
MFSSSVLICVMGSDPDACNSGGSKNCLDYAEALRLGRQALEVDDADPDLLANFGRAIGAWSDDYDAAKNMADRAVALNPNSAHAWSQRGWTYRYVKDSKVSFGLQY